MLEYRKYRNNFVENAPEQQEEEETIDATIDRAIDAWIRSLKMALVTKGPEKRGLWDRFKNTLANVWHGREGEANPYKFVNKFGDKLGQPVEQAESVVLLPLSDYKELRTICESLEEVINEDNPLAGTENLRLIQVIDQKAQQLKDALKRIVATSHTGNNFLNPNNSAEEPEPVKPTVTEPEHPSDPTALPADTNIPNNHATHIPPNIDGHSMAVSADGKPSGDEDVPKADEDEPLPLPIAKPAKTSWENLEDDEKFTTRPTRSNKSWMELNPEDHRKWNVYGGGVEHKYGRQPYAELPWILRIGDPRIADIENRKNKRQLNTLVNQGRIESHDKPIANKIELESRVQEAKESAEKAQKIAAELRAKNRTLGGEEQTGQIGAALEKSRAGELTPKQEDPVSPPEVTEKKPYVEPEFKTAEMPMKHTPDNNLAPTAHKQDFKIGDMPTDDDKTHTPVASDYDKKPMPSEDTPKDPDAGTSEDPLINDKKLSKAKLTDYVMNNIKNQSARDDLFTKIASIKSKPELIQIRDAIWQALEDEEITGEDGKQKPLGLEDKVESVRNLVKAYKLKLERQKFDILSVEGKIRYFKELLKNN